MKSKSKPILKLGLLILFLVSCGTAPLTPESTSAVGSISSVAPTSNLISSTTSAAATPQPTQYVPTQWITPAFEMIATPQNLQALGMTFVPVDPTDPQATGTITKEHAVSAALKEQPGLIHATYYSARFGWLTSTTIPILAVKRLVWMVTYQGIETSSSGPPGVKHYVSHEHTMVMDAHDGHYIVSFPIFDLTPVPNPLAPTSTPAA